MIAVLLVQETRRQDHEAATRSDLRRRQFPALIRSIRSKYELFRFTQAGLTAKIIPSEAWWTWKGRDMTDRWLSVDEIADYLGVSKDTVYGWISKREMPAHKVGRLWKFKTTEVDEWVRTGKASDDYSS